MYDLDRVLDLQLRAMEKPRPVLIIPEIHDPRVVAAAERLTRYANLVLLIDEDELLEVIAQHDLARDFHASTEHFLRKVRCVDVSAEHQLRQEFAEKLVELGQNKHWACEMETASRKVLEPVYFAVLATRLGYADMVIGGVSHASRDFFQPCLRLLERQDVVYEMALFALPDEHIEEIYQHNLVMFADVALNPIPTAHALAKIAIGSCKTMRDIIPQEDLEFINCALLSYSTRGSGEGPSVQRIREAAALIPDMLRTLCEQDPIYESIHVDAELQISVAVSQKAAKSKLGEDLSNLKAAGKASILVAPNLDVGNLLYHIYAARYADSQKLLFIGGLHNRALDFSRSCSTDDLIRGAKGLILRNLKSVNWRPTEIDHFFPRYRVLSINPGSTSTKLALFHGEERVFEVVERHDGQELVELGSISAQLALRTEVVESVLESHDVEKLDAVVARGGLVRPLTSGTYSVNQDMLSDLGSGAYGEHPSNLGAPIAKRMAEKFNVDAFVVDPPVVDELDETSRITGVPGVERRAAWHALNQKACAKRFAEERGQAYERLNLIVAHMGGGISVGAHRKGRCVQVRDALYDGPMTPQRVGSLPQRELIKMCFATGDSKLIEDMLVRQGGFSAHLGTSDLEEVERRIEHGDDKAALLFEAMAQQIAMEICSLVPKFLGAAIDRIILTGGMAHSILLVDRLIDLVTPLSVPITVLPGEDELEALCEGAARVLVGHEQPLEYRSLLTAHKPT